MSDNIYTLNRFIDAQKSVYEQVVVELLEGDKQTHWMWFIFPQINGLGQSSTAKLYSIKSKEEAIAYLEHAILGKRIKECVEILLKVNGKTASQIFGFPDDMKLKSSMTLFAYISGNNSEFHRVLDKFYNGKEDEKTLALLQKR